MVAFLLELLAPAYDYFDSQWDIRTPALELRDGARVAAIGLAAIVMLGTATVQLLQRVAWRRCALVSAATRSAIPFCFSRQTPASMKLASSYATLE